MIISVYFSVFLCKKRWSKYLSQDSICGTSSLLCKFRTNFPGVTDPHFYNTHLLRHSVPPPSSGHPPFCWEVGGWTSYQIFKKGRAWQNLNFEWGVAGKEMRNFFQGGGAAIFTKKKNKPKPEIFNDKKVYK